jgi:PPIC-type PPIASE domain
MRALACSVLLAIGCASAPPRQTERAEVQHVLIAWAWLEPGYRKQGLPLDPRAQNRTEKDAEALAQRDLARCKAGEPFEALMKQDSEDPGSASNGMVYTVTPDSRMAPQFVDASLSLKPGECALAKSQFGLHVVKRLR